MKHLQATIRWYRRRLLSALALALCAGPLLAQVQPEVRFSVGVSRKDLLIREQILPDQTKVSHVSIQGAELLDVPGYPKVPFVSRFVALPRGAKIVSLDVKTGQESVIQGIQVLAWGQPARPGWEPSPPSFPKGDDGPVYYPPLSPIGPSPVIQQLESWPQTSASVAGIEDHGWYQIARIAIFPAVWHPSAGTMTFNDAIDLGVLFEGGKTGQPGRGYADQMEMEESRLRVVNAEFFPPILINILPLDLDAWHLIITDNVRWNAAAILPGSAVTGDMVAEFQRLADWKTKKGVPSAVVTVTDIVNGVYGNFTTGSRDLQEVIRKFLQHARAEFNTHWVVLGGDVSVIPAREVLGNVWGGRHHFHLDTSKTKPDKGGCYYDAGSATARIHANNLVKNSSAFFSQKTGRKFFKVAAPSLAAPGWAWATNDNYTAVSAVTTEYVLLRGPAADIENVNFYIDAYENTIPTDLYYASLEAPTYHQPGLHDWDLNDNGVYGQADYTNPFDGVDYRADIGVGRGPVETAAEANAFVDKVIAYEKYQGFPADFARKVLFGSSNWGGGPAVDRTLTNPPGEGKYLHPDGSTSANLHFNGPPDSAYPWKLIAYDAPGDWWEVPYNREASPVAPGYYYCTDGTYSTYSGIFFDFGFFSTEWVIHTPFIRVYGPAVQIRPEYYFFDYDGPDGSLTEKEEIRTTLSIEALQVNLRQRLYQDYVDAPTYPAANLSELSEDAMRAELNTGYNIVSLSGHGWWGGCCGVDYSWVPTLTNGLRGGLVFVDSCLTGEFNVHPSDLNDSVAELFVKSSSGGAAAYIGSARYSWIGHGHALETDLWQTLPYSRRVGVLHNSKANHTEDWAKTWANFSLNLFGDPEMPLWLNSPKTFTVTRPVLLRAGADLVATVRDPDGSLVSGARVCFRGPGSFYGIHTTTETGVATVSTEGLADGDEVEITVTKTDFIPYEGITTIGHLPQFIRGDANGDLKLDISDALTVFGVLFLGQGKIPCADAADSNDDGQLDIADGIKVLGFLFTGDKLPPGTKPGQPQTDETPDKLDC